MRIPREVARSDRMIARWVLILAGAGLFVVGWIGGSLWAS